MGSTITTEGAVYRGDSTLHTRVSRFVETVLAKLATDCPLAALEAFLVETSPSWYGKFDVLSVLENNKDLFELHETENGLIVSLTVHTEAASNAAVIGYLKKYLWNTLSFTESRAVSLDTLAADVAAKSPPNVRRHFDGNQISTLKAIFDVHSAQFNVTTDDKVYLTVYPFEKKRELFCDALRYFYDVLYALAVCGHRAVCYNVLINCVQNAPHHVQDFLESEYPGVALIDFFQCMSQIFDTSSKPCCVSLAFLDELVEGEIKEFSPGEPEWAAVEYFAYLLWVVRQGLLILKIELWLDEISDPVRAYCKKQYPHGLLPFFLSHPDVFSYDKTSAIVKLLPDLPKFCPRVTKRAGKSAKVEDAYLTVEAGDIEDCQVTRFEQRAKLFFNSSEHFQLEDNKVLVTDSGCLESLMIILNRKLDSLEKKRDTGCTTGCLLTGLTTSADDYSERELVVPSKRLVDVKDDYENEVRESLFRALKEMDADYYNACGEATKDPFSLGPASREIRNFPRAFCVDDKLMQILENEDDISVCCSSSDTSVSTPAASDPVCESIGMHMLFESQNCAKQITDFLKALLASSKKQYTVTRATVALRKHDPKLADFCEKYYHHGMLGFVRCHSHVFETWTFGKPSKLEHVLRVNEDPSPELVSVHGVVTHLYESHGHVFCHDPQCLVRFPSWSFLDESRKMHASLNTVLAKKCPVNVYAMKNDRGRLSVLAVTQCTSGKRAKVHVCKCVVISEGPYYALLSPLQVKNPPKCNIPPLPEVTVFFVHPNASLKDGEVVDANVKVLYPLPRLWQALQVLNPAHAGSPSPSSVGSDVKIVESAAAGDKLQNSPLPDASDEQHKKDMHQAVDYFLSAILRAGNDVPVTDLESLLQRAPAVVQDFCRNNFPGGLARFFSRYAHAFRLLDDGKVRASANLKPNLLPPAHAGSERCPRVWKSPSCPGLSEKSFSVQPLTAKAKERPCPATCVLRGVFGTITGLWGQGAQVTSDLLEEPVNVLSASFVLDNGTVSVTMTSVWHLGDKIEFDAVCGAEVRVTCAFKAGNKEFRNTVTPVTCACKVALVTPHYALLTLCHEDADLEFMDDSVILLFSYPKPVKLELTQTVEVTAIPGYPSQNFWKVLSLLG